MKFALIGFACLLYTKTAFVQFNNVHFPIDETADSSSQNPFILNDIDAARYKIVSEAKGNYLEEIKAIEQWRDSTKAVYSKLEDGSAKQTLLNEASTYLTEKLLNTIVPHWYGTKWDYYGHTNTPGEGLIACGYFVSTTMKHVGFNLNRFKLAQAYSLQAVKVLESETYINLGGKTRYEMLKSVLSSEPDGLFVVGLDNHIGYLLKRKSEMFFLHSSYLDPVAVVLEKAGESDALAGHENYLIARVTGNKALVEKWLTQTEIKVP